MYKKKDKKVMIIAGAIVVAFIALIYILPGLGNSFGKKEPEETEEISYEVLIHKNDAGKIDVKKSWLKDDGESETKLSVKPGTLVSLTVTPKKNKILEEVRVVDATDFSNEISTIVNETKENTYIVDFSMPETDVVMTFTFETKETEEKPEEPAVSQTEHKEEETQAQTETEEAGNPYGLTVHGITADLIASYNGLFDDRDFCQQLGDALHLESPRSEYYGITDVTFSQEKYTGEKDSDKVYSYIYFGLDPDFKMLSTYYMKDRSYIFTKYVEPEPETEAPADPANENPAGSGETSQGSTPGETTYSPYETGGTPERTFTSPGTGSSRTDSFDILRVSKTFLDYTGDQEAFYSQAFDYVLSKGLTGSIMGTMSSYEIDTEGKKAAIEIKLNNGKSFKAVYDKKNNKYSFSGL